MEKTIKVCKNIEGLSRIFAEKFAGGVREVPDGSFFSIGLSGGSTPRLVFSYLAENFRDGMEWGKVKIFWGDERCVPAGNEESNFRMAKESLLDHVPIPAGNIFRIRGEDPPAAEAERYSEITRQNIQSVDMVPGFDLLMLGLGEDGHTASIFPQNPHVFSSNRLFETSENPYTGQKRITATGKIINHAKTVIFLVTGEPKAEIAAGVINEKKGWEHLPASMVRPVDGELIWLLDEAAAMKLTIF